MVFLVHIFLLPTKSGIALSRIAREGLNLKLHLMPLKDGKNLIISLPESILEIIQSAECTEKDTESFIDIGCYLYRASLAVMELQTPVENTQKDSLDILQSLLQSIDLAKNLIKRCQKCSDPIPNTELKSIIEQLEGVINHMGESLSLIPSSILAQQEYVEISIKSLSNEMKNARVHVDPTMEDTDLYSIKVEAPTESYQILDIGTKYVEPFYETFICPLTKEIMDDPVTIESGVTYERKAITEWFEKCENSEVVHCPKTGKKLLTRFLRSNVALRTTIDEWKDRNEVAKIKIARAALSLASSKSMVIEAMKDLESICQRKPYNKVQVCNAGIVSLIAQFLDYRDREVRYETLKMLRQLAEDDDEGKKMVGESGTISKAIKMLSSNHQLIRHASLLLLLELSRSESLCEEIGLINGAILMLVTIKYNQSNDSIGSENADKILKNLEIHPKNIKRMAESGLLEPLLNHLTEGSEEMKMEMGSYLGEIVLGDESKTYVAKRASPSLIQMVHSGNPLTRKAAFDALLQISSYPPNAKALVEAGIIKLMIEEMFTRRIYDEPMNSKEEAAEILANVLETEVDLETLKVNTHGHRLASEYIVYNILYLLKNSTPDELNLNLIRILLCLTKSTKSTATIVSVIKETEASHTLIEFINNPHEELVIAAIKLLITLSSHMGHTIAEKLCKTKGQPESLIQNPTAKIARITEKQVVSANFLAKLPHDNLTLNLALLNNNTVPTIIQTINQIQTSGTRTNRYASAYLESLLAVLVRFTSTLYEPQILFLAMSCNFTSVFTELLTKTSTDEAQRLSAIGLKNLSSQSINLSKPGVIKRTHSNKLHKFLSGGLSKRSKELFCPVHRGLCSSQGTFCLLEANAVERLLTCLENENVDVVEAALSALCTLLDDKVDVEKGVSLLNELNAIKYVMNLARQKGKEGLRQKAFWVIERFLMKGGDESSSDISKDRSLPCVLVNAFHHGDGETKQMAENILKRLNRMPNCTTNFTM